MFWLGRLNFCCTICWTCVLSHRLNQNRLTQGCLGNQVLFLLGLVYKCDSSLQLYKSCYNKNVFIFVCSCVWWQTLFIHHGLMWHCEKWCFNSSRETGRQTEGERETDRQREREQSISWPTLSPHLVQKKTSELFCHQTAVKVTINAVCQRSLVLTAHVDEQ